MASDNSQLKAYGIYHLLLHMDENQSCDLPIAPKRICAPALNGVRTKAHPHLGGVRFQAQF